MTKPYCEREEFLNRAKEAAILYKQGYSYRDFNSLEGFSRRDIERAFKLGLVERRTKSEAGSNWVERNGPTIMSKEAREKLSKRISQDNPGGRSKWFVVSGKKVQGTWERNLAYLFEELGILWERCKPMPYFLSGVKKNYTPDFYLPDSDIYVEVKGYWWGNDREKMKAVIEQHPDKQFKIVEKEEYNKLMEGELVWS